MAHHVPNGIKGIGKTIYNPIKHSQNCIWLIFAKQAWGTNFPCKISMLTFFQTSMYPWIDFKKANSRTLEWIGCCTNVSPKLYQIFTNFLLEEMCAAEKCKYWDSCRFSGDNNYEGKSNFSGNYGFDAGYFWQYHNKGPSFVKWL